MKGIDLNYMATYKILGFPGIFEVNYVYRQTRLRSGNGAPSNEGFSPMRETLQWQPQSKIIQLPRPISLHGFCAIDLQRKPPCNRNLPSVTKRKALSPGNTWWDFSQHTFQCQQGTRLENLRRLCSSTDKGRQTTLCRGGPRTRPRQYDLRTRCIYYRSLSFSFSMGVVSFNQVSNKITYPARSAGQHPNLYPYFGWQASRRQYTRYPGTRAWRLLYHGSRLPGFWKAFQVRTSKCIFRHPIQKQYPVQASLLSSSNHRCSVQWSEMRSNHRTNRHQCKSRLSAAATTNQVPRQQNWQSLQLSDQQLYYSSADNSRSLSLPMASRTLFQMDQTTPENQIVFRNHRECSKDSDLDCYLGLRARCHHQEATKTRNGTLHNFTDFEPYTIRENPIGSVTYEPRSQTRGELHG